MKRKFDEKYKKMTPKDKEHYARLLGVSKNYLYQIVTRKKNPFSSDVVQNALKNGIANDFEEKKE